MSLSGIKRIVSGVLFVRDEREKALVAAKTSTMYAGSQILVDACRRLVADRPGDLEQALMALGRAQRDVSQAGSKTRQENLTASHAIVKQAFGLSGAAAKPWHPHQIRGRMQFSARRRTK